MKKYCVASKLSLLLILCSSAALARETDKPLTHEVTENARSLTEISLSLYGTSKLSIDIAKWNHLSNPNKIKLGQKLILNSPPSLSTEQGSNLLLKHWRKHFGMDLKTQDAERVKIEIQKKETVKQKFKEAAPLAAQEAEFEPSSAEQNFQKGKQLFDEKHYEKALLRFRESRESDPEYLPSWFFEIRVLRLLKRTEEEEKTKILFLKKHPRLAPIPFFKKMPNEAP